MKLNVRLFARARDLARADSVSLDLPDYATVSDLRRVLVERIPSLEGLASRLYVAIDNEYAADSRTLESRMEVACFPPVSGG